MEREPDVKNELFRDRLICFKTLKMKNSPLLNCNIVMFIINLNIEHFMGIENLFYTKLNHITLEYNYFKNRKN